jgi:tripartite-type tricarboxylate transporter receptor subunit TctC
MNPARRAVVSTLGGFAASLLVPVQSHANELAQARILVGFPPGGGTDVCARLLADGLRGRYAKTVLVDNRPGAGGKIAVDEMRRQGADGSAMVMQPESVLTLSQHVDPKTTHFRFDDLAPVAAVALMHHAFFVGPAVPSSVQTMQDYLAWAQANPGKANFGTPGNNSTQDFLMRSAGADRAGHLTHAPYRGSAPGVQDLLGGQISAFFSPVGDGLPHQASGRMRALGTSGDKRSRFTPQVPTFAEQGLPKLTLTEYYGVWMSSAVPEPVRARAAHEVGAFVARPENVEAFAKFGIEPAPLSLPAFAAAMRSSHQAWGERLASIGYRPQE